MIGKRYHECGRKEFTITLNAVNLEKKFWVIVNLDSDLLSIVPISIKKKKKVSFPFDRMSGTNYLFFDQTKGRFINCSSSIIKALGMIERPDGSSKCRLSFMGFTV